MACARELLLARETRAVIAAAAGCCRRGRLPIGGRRARAVTEESEHTAGRNGTGGCAVAAACSLLYLSSSTLSPAPALPIGAS